ncbi:MAG: IS630 family transposase [Actinobacteria bacterium]|nr:IS630 family transposase [Actinomycetota bacterium]
MSEQRTLLFLDETGVYLLPAAVRTYAPIGQTPILHETLTRDHRSLIGAITPGGHVHVRGQDRAFTSADVVGFLKQLQRQIGTKLLVVWDGAPIHYGEVKTFLAQGAATDIHIARFPGYAPDLNPIEGVWQHLKQVELKNVCCHDLDELRSELGKAIARLRHKPQVIDGCMRQVGCYS